MPNFKPKANKKIARPKKSSVTVDSKHREKMAEFDNIKNVIIPKLKKECADLKMQLKRQVTNKLTIDKKLDIQDKIKANKKLIIKYKKQRKIYLLDNSKYIFDYYEKKKSLVDVNISKTKIVHSFFKKKTQNSNTQKEKASNTQQYLINIDDSFLNINDYVQSHEVCANCNGELIPVEYEGVMICNKCSHQVNFLIEHEKPSYKDPPKEVCFYAYKRINHFREILAQFQAKETTQIPEEVLTNIIQQIKKERLSLDKMSNKKAKEILKKLGHNKYYEHIPFIKDKLGIKPPIMSPQLEETLCCLFMDIQKPYAKHCPDYRVNFLNYYYVLYKMCELLGETHFLPFFPMLKDPVKRIEQDEIWKKICKEIHWEFVPTI